jgi:hypothetical protein
MGVDAYLNSDQTELLIRWLQVQVLNDPQQTAALLGCRFRAPSIESVPTMRRLQVLNEPLLGGSAQKRRIDADGEMLARHPHTLASFLLRPARTTQTSYDSKLGDELPS